EDIVTEYDGMAVEGALELKALARGTQPNRSVRLQVLRDGRTFSMSVTGGFLGVAIEDGVARN
ncbi:MAG: PDZ domain-containing protein, partial [Deltaproteobacteria bacterium]|nr:PDZ domain-containing protein [Deltaproteobacteria bacterium]